MFPVLNNLIGILQKAHWSVLGLAGNVTTIEADAAKVKKPLAALSAYFKNTCKLG